MFGLSSLQICQQSTNWSGMKAPTNILEEFLKAETLATAEIYNRINGTNITKKDYQNNLEETLLNGRKTPAERLITVQETSCPDFQTKNDDKCLNSKLKEVTRNELKRQSNSIPKVSLEQQRKKFLQVINYLNRNNQKLENELAKEKRRRADDLSKIIKSLLCFEAKLKRDKKLINKQLYDKDNAISRLININKILREKYGEFDEEQISNIYSLQAQFCRNCRKEYYDIEEKNIWTQTATDEEFSKDELTELGSSSDETLSSSFYGARRSIRYTSKRTFGTFRDYMRSRSMNIDDSNFDNSEENASTVSRDESQYGSLGQINVYSRKMEKLHGVRRIESFTDETEPESENDHKKNCNSIEYDDDTFQQEDEIFINECTSRNQKKNLEHNITKESFETSTDDWYASASDVDDTDTLSSKPYACNAVNPVLECVNQILLQQAMDGGCVDNLNSLDSNENNNGNSFGNKDNTGPRKRVHFSTKNSMVHVPRDNISSPTNHLDNSDSKNYESVYSNEYEPIGSENNSSNFYVDMETRLGNNDHKTPSTHPPKLPPKPANLIKLRKVLRMVPQSCISKRLECKSERQSVTNLSEPDYCSISEINEGITSVQTIADVHRPPDYDSCDQNTSNNMSLIEKTEDIEEILSDVPKLPNVAAIIVPKISNKFNQIDNCLKNLTNKDENSFKKTSSSQLPNNVLIEINKKLNSTPISIVKNNNTVPLSPCKIFNNINLTTSNEKLPIEAEFDWYNLDVEYGRTNQQDITRATDSNSLESLNTDNNSNIETITLPHSIEYNLDEEFSLTNSQPDIVKENILELPQLTTNSDTFPTIADQTPCSLPKKAKVRPNFSSFIEGSGLSTKPLPRQRKIYFSGPFV